MMNSALRSLRPSLSLSLSSSSLSSSSSSRLGFASLWRNLSTNGDAAASLPDNVDELKELLQKSKAEVVEKDNLAKETQDKYLRTLAEMENVRERGRKDMENAKHFAISKFSKELLEVVDVLGMAIDSVPKDEISKVDNTHLKNLFDGIQMTEKEMLKVFEKNGLKPIDPLGEKFDPNQHEALFQIPDPAQPHGTVGVVRKKGYSLHGRTIRAAQVGVIKAK